MLETPEEVLEKGLQGRAASFFTATGDLFVNGLYEAIDRTVTDMLLGARAADWSTTEVPATPK